MLARPSARWLQTVEYDPCRGSACRLDAWEIRAQVRPRSFRGAHRFRGWSVSRVLSPPEGGWRSFIWTSRCRLALPPRGAEARWGCGTRPTRRSCGRGRSYPGRVRPALRTRGPKDRCADRLLGLAGGGVCPAGDVADAAVRSYRTISPLPDPLRAIGCVFSVALSLRLLPVAVSHHRALPCSDFPPRLAPGEAERPPDQPRNR